MTRFETQEENPLMPSRPEVDELVEVVKSGSSWLGALQRLSGEYKTCDRDLAGYYKSPLVFAECGSVEKGIRCIDYIRKNFLTADSELRSNTHKTSLVRMERNLANYMDGWIALGAWLLGEFELAVKISQRLILAQEKSLGGIETGPIKWSIQERYDLATAASCGRAFLRIGYRDAALAAGRFLCEALDHQDNVSAGLNLSFSSDWDCLQAENESERTYYWFDLSRRREKVWFPAFSCGFLSELFETFGNAELLDSACKYFDFIEATPEFKDGTLANGKSAWAAGRLYKLTKNDRYWSAFMRIAPNVIGRQAKNGEFLSSAAEIKSSAEQDSVANRGPMLRRTERTAEFTMWAAEYIKLVAV